ncbi:GtrA family protein [Streptomyces sp. TRM43335]|uniref:GtrA family protein n=1 Tax=Streptomyces taklimakanensis TaxID=2569853 RepID=A0A6G2BB18_9ACTN|nr:GtrA family protein [Streptomyces taklimakanensis]MTE19326.1 GtrA family protein [Streptomyces taklimakanensis]
MGERYAPRSRLLRLRREMARFGTVGAFGFLVNVAVFNLCIHGLGLAPVRSGVTATAVAVATNYLGNRYWTYRHTDKSRIHREAGLFLLFSGIGLVIENGALALSHYGLGLTSPLADNIAKNVVGLGVATVFRFWAYRTWVFRIRRGERDGHGRRHGRRDRRGPSVAGRLLGHLSAEEEREDRRVLLK